MAALTPSGARESARALKAKLAPAEGTGWGVSPLGDPKLDARLPGGGLARGRWHEIAGAGCEQELPAAATGFAACLARAAAGEGMIVWALPRDDLYPPGLSAFGLDPARLIYVRGADDADVLAIMEDALATRGVSAVLGEAARVDLIAGKRLQLAAARFGATGLVLRRQIYGARRAEAGGSAAMTRWRVAPAPSRADEPGLGPARWIVRLERCRGGREGAWEMEADDATGHVRVLAELADHALAPDRLPSGPAGPRDGEPDRRRAAHRGG